MLLVNQYDKNLTNGHVNVLYYRKQLLVIIRKLFRRYILPGQFSALTEFLSSTLDQTLHIPNRRPKPNLKSNCEIMTGV